MLPYHIGSPAFLAQAFGAGPVPLMTGIDPNKEPAFQAFVAAHPEKLSGPARDYQNKLISRSLYDYRGAVYDHARTQQNVQDGELHFSDKYKLPGNLDVEKNIGLSGFSNESNLGHLFPQNAGSWHGDENGEMFYANPIQFLNPQTFYPSWFGGSPTQWSPEPEAFNPLTGNSINGLVGSFGK